MGLFYYQGAHVSMQLEVLSCASVFNEDVALNYHRGQESQLPRASGTQLLAVITTNVFPLSD